jgi:hypothetical protein
MSKTTIAFLVVGLVLVGGYFALNFQKEESAELANKETGEAKNEDTVAKPVGKKMAFSQFIKQDKGSYKCEVSQAMSDIESKGTIYMNGGNMRGDFNTVAEGRSMNSSFIMMGGYTYNWSNLAPMGVKVKVDANGGNASAEASGTYSWNAEQIGDYNCEPWVVDEGTFELPDGVKFTEIKA